MTDPRIPETPPVAVQLAQHVADIESGELATPTLGVLVEFYPNQPAYAFTLGLPQGVSRREMLGQLLLASEVLARAARGLNGQAAY